MIPARTDHHHPDTSEEDTLTTTKTRAQRTTKTAPEFPTAEDIAAAVHEHGIEERRDQEAADALEELVQQIAREDSADHARPAHEVFREARISGDWQAYREALEHDAAAAERARVRRGIIQTLRDQRARVAGVDSPRLRHRAEAGRLTLDYLADALPSILDAAQDLDLDGLPSNPEAVMNAGPEAVEKFNKVRVVVDAYAALRRTQAQAVMDVSRDEHGASGVSDHGVKVSGQFRNALHFDATRLAERRAALSTLRHQRDRDHIRRYSPGAAEFFDQVPPEVFGPIGDDGFPTEVRGIISRAAWLRKWAGRLEFFVPDFEELGELNVAHNQAVNPRAWRDHHGVVIVLNNIGGRPASGNAEAVDRLLNLSFKRPDWDGKGDDAEAEALADAAEANRQAARLAEHPGYAA